MKYLFHFVLIWLFFHSIPTSAQDQSPRLGLIEILSASEKVDRKLVTVQGFLRIDHEPRHGVRAILYLHEEDANHLLASNGVLVLPNAEMLRDEEKINNMYVVLTGVVRSMQAANGGHIVTIEDVRSCVPWSNPKHPIGLQK